MGTASNKFFTVDRIINKCELGDLVEIYLPKCTFNHWAVYVGDGSVVHVKQPWIRKENLLTVAGENLVRINNVKHKKALNYPALVREKIVEAALEQLGLEWYNLQFYGCEMFAVRCRYGVKVNMTDLYKSNNVAIGRAKDSTAVSLSNPLVTYGHVTHENQGL